MYRVDQHLTGTEKEEYVDNLKMLEEAKQRICDGFDGSFARHMFIEYYYREDCTLLNESLISESILLEKYGLFVGCNYISDKIRESVKPYLGMKVGEKSQVLVPIQNDWLGTVRVYLENNPSELANGAYYPNYTYVTQNSDGKPFFREISIKINMFNVDGRLWWVRVFAIHELTHAYEDYNRRCHGEKGLFYLGKKRGLGKYKLLKQSERTERVTKLKNIFYIIDPSERNAFIASVRGELEQCTEPFKDVQEVIEWCKGTDSYIFFRTTLSQFQEFVNVTDEKEQEDILEDVKKVTELQFRDYHHFIQYVSDNLEKSVRKFNTMIPNYAVDVLGLGYETPSPAPVNKKYTKEELDEAERNFLSFYKQLKEMRLKK